MLGNVHSYVCNDKQILLKMYCNWNNLLKNLKVSLRQEIW